MALDERGRTVTQRIRRIWCWFRGHHVRNEYGGYAFRYDCSGVCYDCGVVGTGVAGDGE